MSIDNYKPNSRTSKIAKPGEVKEEPKKEKVEKIVKGIVKSKKKNAFLGLFMPGDILDLKDYIIQDVCIPAIKNAIEDVVTNGISMMLRGETSSRSSRKSTASRVSYRSYYEREERDRDSRDRGRSRTNGYAYDEVILETRAEALDVLTRLEEIIDMYETASVADLYDLVGMSGQHTDCKYGWTDVRSADTVRVRDGYLLKMPRAKPLD